MVVGVGCDLVQVERIERAMQNPRFISHVYTQAEQAYLQSKGVAKVSSAAGFFAAKEAIAKALGTGIRGFGFQDIEIIHDELGKPSVQLHAGAAKQLAQLQARAMISISHEKTMAMAYALLES